MAGVISFEEVPLLPLEQRYTVYFFYPEMNAWEEVDVNATCHAHAERLAKEWAARELQAGYTEVRCEQRFGLYW